MTKAEIDRYFQENWRDIQNVVKNNASKCATKNTTDITSDIYLICMDKKETINNLPAYIRILASNIYRWNVSSFNRKNRSTANEIEYNGIEVIEEKDREDELMQSRLFYIEKYRLEAEPHELIFFDIFVNKNIRTVRGLSKEVGVTHRGAMKLIKDFKSKIQNYERQEQAI